MITINDVLAKSKKDDYVEVYDGEAKVFAGYVTEIYANAVILVEQRRMVETPKTFGAPPVITWFKGGDASFDTKSKYKFKLFQPTK